MTGSIKLRWLPRQHGPPQGEKCGRAGQYAKGKLISIHGPDIPLPDLLVEIAQCERRGQMHDACGVHYLGLQGQ